MKVNGWHGHKVMRLLHFQQCHQSERCKAALCQEYTYVCSDFRIDMSMFFNYDNEQGSDCLIPSDQFFSYINHDITFWDDVGFILDQYSSFCSAWCNKNQQLDMLLHSHIFISLFRANPSLLFLLDAANTNFTSYRKEWTIVVITNSTIFQLYHGQVNFQRDEEVHFVLNKHAKFDSANWNNRCIHIILIAACLEEKQQMPNYSLLWFDPIGNRTHYQPTIAPPMWFVYFENRNDMHIFIYNMN